jgi:hypothetical protein
LLVGSLSAADWTQFRGPGGLGAGNYENAPTTWSEDTNIAWRSELPGAGTSSPIVLGDRIYLTCYSGYGLDANEPGEMGRLTRHVVCLDRATGELIWTRPFQPQLPESGYSRGNDAKHGYASATPTTDGERLYVFFGKSGVYCLSLEGEPIWNTSVGDKVRGWGSSNSPVLFGDLVIVNASVESGSLVGLDKLSGEMVWQVDGIRSSWNTPALVETSAGSTEMVISMQKWILGVDPATGKELWRTDGVPTYACPSAVSHDGIVYVTGGRGTQYTFAVRAGGRGDVTQSHVLWRVAKGSNVSSPVYHDGYLYLANDSKGIVFCLNAENGDVAYQERLNPRPNLIYSSPVLVDSKLYYVSQHTGVFVVPARPEFELLAHNQFADDDHRANACPVIHDGQLLLRDDRYLHCIGEETANER